MIESQQARDNPLKKIGDFKVRDRSTKENDFKC